MTMLGICQVIAEVREVYNTVIQVCLCWRNGIIRSQILPPSRLIQILKISQDSFLRDLEVPVVLSEAYAYVLFDIISVDVYLENNLVYTVQVPLVMHSVFTVFRVIPFPMQVKGVEGRFALTQPEKEFIVINGIKCFYARLAQTDIQLCKRIQVKELICKQDFPLFSSHSSIDCEVLMLQPIWLLPQSCTQRTVDLKETLWIPLRDCMDLYGTSAKMFNGVLYRTETHIYSVLTFLSTCTGYGNTVISLIVHCQYTNKGINQPLSLTHHCCEVTVDALPLGEILLEAPIKSIPTHYRDFHLANHKVENVRKLVGGQEWKGKHTTQKNMSLLSVIGTMIFVVLFGLFCCSCCFCCCCRNCWLWIMRWCYFDDNMCRAVVYRPKIVSSISTSNVDGHRRGLAFSLMSRAHIEQDSQGEPTELRHSWSHSKPKPLGKR
jgi:hypothetical protein